MIKNYEFFIDEHVLNHFFLSTVTTELPATGYVMTLMWRCCYDDGVSIAI